jgi:hypothetical protein
MVVVGEVALETAHRLHAGITLCFLALQVSVGWWVDPASAG